MSHGLGSPITENASGVRLKRFPSVMRPGSQQHKTRDDPPPGGTGILLNAVLGEHGSSFTLHCARRGDGWGSSTVFLSVKLVSCPRICGGVGAIRPPQEWVPTSLPPFFDGGYNIEGRRRL